MERRGSIPQWGFAVSHSQSNDRTNAVPMTTLEDILSEGERDDAEQAIEDDQERKERERREERRASTKYGGRIEGEINNDG